MSSAPASPALDLQRRRRWQIALHGAQRHRPGRGLEKNKRVGGGSRRIKKTTSLCAPVWATAHHVASGAGAGGRPTPPVPARAHDSPFICHRPSLPGRKCEVTQGPGKAVPRVLPPLPRGRDVPGVAGLGGGGWWWPASVALRAGFPRSGARLTFCRALSPPRGPSLPWES